MILYCYIQSCKFLKQTKAFLEKRINKLAKQIGAFGSFVPCSKLFLQNTNPVISPISLLLLKIGALLTQYHFIEIQVDKQKDRLVFILNSRMSGREVKSCGIKEASSILVYPPGLKRFLFSPVTLNILLPEKRIFRVTTRYGFS